jgi:hypothetical protein
MEINHFQGRGLTAQSRILTSFGMRIIKIWTEAKILYLNHKVVQICQLIAPWNLNKIIKWKDSRTQMAFSKSKANKIFLENSKKFGAIWNILKKILLKRILNPRVINWKKKMKIMTKKMKMNFTMIFLMKSIKI